MDYHDHGFLGAGQQGLRDDVTALHGFFCRDYRSSRLQFVRRLSAALGDLVFAGVRVEF